MSVDGIERAVDVENEVDAGICQSVHASIVVDGVIYRVDTNGVDS